MRITLHDPKVSSSMGPLQYIGNPPESHLALKSHKIFSADNIQTNSPIILKFCTEHGSITAVL